MAEKPSRPGPRDPDRRWRIPPVPAHASHSFAGAALLEELSGPLGFALWQSFRDVQLWSLTAPRERTHLFAPGAARTRAAALEGNGTDPELRAPIRTLLAMVEDAPGTRPRDVAGACAAIARWAEARGAVASALAFAEAAAGADPDGAALAWQGGRLARRRGEYARAETWFLRSAGLGRRSGDWESYVLAFLGMGRLYLQRRNMARTRKLCLRALRAARRHGLRGLEGEAMHDLLAVHFEFGDLAGAEAWGREVYRVYGPRHPELPRVVHDLAMIWVARGYYARAEAVIRALLPHFLRPADRLLVLASWVRAAGGAGNRPAFEEGWSTAWALAADPGVLDSCARSFLDMAQGALSIGDERRAREAALRCLEFGVGRDETKACLEAEALLRTLDAGRPAPRISTPADLPQDDAGDAFAREIIAGLVVGAGG